MSSIPEWLPKKRKHRLSSEWQNSGEKKGIKKGLRKRRILEKIGSVLFCDPCLGKEVYRECI